MAKVTTVRRGMAPKNSRRTGRIVNQKGAFGGRIRTYDNNGERGHSDKDMGLKVKTPEVHTPALSPGNQAVPEHGQCPSVRGSGANNTLWGRIRKWFK